jgi:hypothetical protein
MNAGLLLALLALFVFARSRAGSGGSGGSGGGDPGSPGGSSRTVTPNRIVTRNGVDVTGRFSKDARAWAADVRQAAEQFFLNPIVLLSVLDQESGGDPGARGGIDELGLMQLRPIAVQDVNENASRLTTGAGFFADHSGMSDPQAAIRYGAAFLAMQKERMGQDLYDALRAYNCGAQGARENPGCGSTYADEVLQRAGRGERAA